MLRVQHARPFGRRPRDLDRRLNRLGARVGGHHRGDACWRPREQRLREHAAQERHPQLRQVAGAPRHHLLYGGDRLGMVAPDREDPVAAEQIQVAPALGVDQVGPLASLPHPVEAQRSQDPPHLRIAEAVVQRHLLTAATAEDLRDARQR